MEMTPLNPATGQCYVKMAEPGDHGDSGVIFDSTNLPSVKLK